MKHFGDQRISAGERCLVVDLGGCPGMDSTFMGTLAGMATRLSAQDGGVLQVADTSPRNRRSLEDLGLDFLLEIDPPVAIWRGVLDHVRERLEAPEALVPGGHVQRAIHVLEAHQVLAETNDKNSKIFSNVVALLGNEVAEKQKLADAREIP